jgi:hypothetical protein
MNPAVRLPSLMVLATITLAGCSFITGSEANRAEPSPSATPSSVSPAPESSAATAISASASSAPITPEKAAPPAPPPPTIKTTALTDFKLPLTIAIPESATLSEAKSKDKLGGVFIDSPTVQLRVMPAPAAWTTVKGIKAGLTKLAHRPVKQFVREEGDLIVYDRGEELDFVLRVPVGGTTYLCQSRVGTSKAEELEPSIQACRTLAKSKP